MSALRSKRLKESSKSTLLALVKKRDERFSAAILEHIEDFGMGKMIEKSLRSPRVNEDQVIETLKKHSKKRHIKEVDDPELLEAMEDSKDPVVRKRGDAALIKLMDEVPDSPTVSRDRIFKILRGKK